MENIDQMDLMMAQGAFDSPDEMGDEEQREYQAWLDSIWVEDIYMDRQIGKMMRGEKW